MLRVYAKINTFQENRHPTLYTRYSKLMYSHLFNKNTETVKKSIFNKGIVKISYSMMFEFYN